MELDVHLVGEPLCKTAQEGAASGQEYSVLDNVGVELGRSLLKDMQYGCLQLGDGPVSK